MKPGTKRFLTLAVIGAIGSAVVMLACGLLADKLIAAWKFEEAGGLVMVIGMGSSIIGQLLALPEIVFSFGSSWPPLEITGLILTFAFWGSLFAWALLRCERRKEKA